MHTFEYWQWQENGTPLTIHHNGDYSGDIIIQTPSGLEMTMPFAAVEELVAEKVRSERMSRLEDATVEELLR